MTVTGWIVLLAVFVVADTVAIVWLLRGDGRRGGMIDLTPDPLHHDPAAARRRLERMSHQREGGRGSW